MDKPETQAVLRQDTEWTNQKHRQYWDKTQNGQVRERGSIETRHRMDKPEKQAALGQDT
jgi:ketosteroid isomerase-like protein